jgi:hypothetical protein
MTRNNDIEPYEKIAELISKDADADLSKKISELMDQSNGEDLCKQINEFMHIDDDLELSKILADALNTIEASDILIDDSVINCPHCRKKISMKSHKIFILGGVR